MRPIENQHASEPAIQAAAERATEPELGHEPAPRRAAPVPRPVPAARPDAAPRPPVPPRPAAAARPHAPARMDARPPSIADSTGDIPRLAANAAARSGGDALNGGAPNGAGSNGHAGAGEGDEQVERGATAPQLRRFIKSRAYVPMHELRRRFAIIGDDDDVTPVDVDRRRVFVGLPDREGRLLGELLRGGDIGYELSMDPITPIVVGVYPMRPVTRA